MRTQRWMAACIALAGSALAGCTSVGPRSVGLDRFDYSTALAESWKQQTLLNIVKIRYTDLPVFVDVSSVVAGYSLQTGVTVGGVFSGKSPPGDYGSVGAQGVYTDRPTITYLPMTGDKFMRGLINPIDPRNIFFMLQSGYPADFILALSVESINGLRNRSTLGGVTRPADPEFIRLLQGLRELQAAGGFGMRVEEDKAKGSTAVLFFRRDDLAPEVREKSAELKRLLNLPVDQQRFTLAYSPLPGGGNELTVNSRSMLQILLAFGSYVEVPAQHLAEKLTRAGFEPGAGEAQGIGRIRSGTQKPASAFVAVQYRGYWFWVEDSDWEAKRALTAIMFFFTLADTGSPDRLPLITIPAQ